MVQSDTQHIEIQNVGNGPVVGVNTGTINYTINQAVRLPSLIAPVVVAMADFDESIEETNAQPKVAFQVEEKIEHNCVIKYKSIIEDYSIFYSQCEEVLDIYDNTKMGAKAKILRCVKNWYSEAKGEFLKINKQSKKSEIELIRENADFLIDKVKDRIYAAVQENANETAYIEDVEIGVVCFVCFCFMACKILEKPK